jgi:hypothetical protein
MLEGHPPRDRMLEMLDRSKAGWGTQPMVHQVRKKIIPSETDKARGWLT